METDKTTAINTAIHNAMVDIIVELWNYYWQDGQEFKDFQKYENILKEEFERAKIADAEFVKVTQKPFGIIYKTCGETFHLFCRRKGNKLDFMTKRIQLNCKANQQ